MAPSKPVVEPGALHPPRHDRPAGALRVAATMGLVACHVALALVIVAGLFPFRDAAGRKRLIRWWSRRVLAICRLDVRIRDHGREAGAPIDAIERALRPDGIGAMLVMNHVSWLDVFIVHALRPASFVARAEIARWPLLGWLTDRTGAIFIERGKRHAVREVNHRAATMLRDGALIGMFPEGQVSDGRRLLPFHANLVQPAIDAGVPIVVAGLRYRDARGRPTDAMYYVGGVSLLDSIVRIVRNGPLIAELHLIDAIDGRTATRHEVARRARVLIADTLGFDDDAHEAAEGLSTVIAVPDELVVIPDGAPGGRGRETMPDPRDELL